MTHEVNHRGRVIVPPPARLSTIASLPTGIEKTCAERGDAEIARQSGARHRFAGPSVNRQGARDPQRNFIAVGLFLRSLATGGAPSSTHIGISMFDDPSGAGVAAFPLLPSGLVSPTKPSFVVAIPVRDEEERLPACLRALAQQRDQLGQPIPPPQIRIALFANNCADQSANLARSLGACWALDVRVVEASLALTDAHAGAARRAAMDIAEAWLAEGGETGRRDPDHRC